MTNEELKKKIVKILVESQNPVEYDDGDWGQTYFPTNEDVADALIAAGIGDTTSLIVENEVLQRDVDNLARTLEEGTEELQEVQHCAEVAEREAIILAKWLANKTRKDYPWKAWFNAAQKQAEKELAEERKDE